MRALTIRDGLIESTDELDAVAVDAEGAVVASWGDPDRPLYYRSSIKPLQATVAQEHGAALVPEHLALACASHSAYPIHLAIVRDMLAGVGLDESHLRCPPAWPLESEARRLVSAAGFRRPRSLFHSCSGKHAGFLRACVARGWSIDGYTQPDHPLQRLVIERVEATSEVAAVPVAVDGCGAAGPRGTLRGLARIFSRLTTREEFTAATEATSRFGALVSGTHRPDAAVARWWGGPLKVGAEGLVGAGRHGLGIAVKSRSGSRTGSMVGLLEVLTNLDLLSAAARQALQEVARPVVFGGGDPHGAVIAQL